MRYFFTICISAVLIFATSCSKSKDMPTEFDIVGQWGVTTVTYANPDGTSSFFKEYPGKYYSYCTFQINGALIVKSEPEGNIQNGTYVYNAKKKTLTYLFDGNKRDIEAWVTVHDPVTITVTADFKEVGYNIYTMKKLAW